ncbi:MAG: hypothetical protein KIT73_03345 [Burkholderiales bacterium]|nr:hypothetical protein [Burkholderiales bacterium]
MACGAVVPGNRGCASSAAAVLVGLQAFRPDRCRTTTVRGEAHATVRASDPNRAYGSEKSAFCSAWQDGGERGGRVIFEATTADHELLTIHDRIYRDEADLAKAEQLCSAIADVLDAEDRGLQRQI